MIREAVATKIRIEIIPGKGATSSRTAAPIPRSWRIRAYYHRAEKESKNFGRLFVYGAHQSTVVLSTPGLLRPGAPSTQRVGRRRLYGAKDSPALAHAGSGGRGVHGELYALAGVGAARLLSPRPRQHLTRAGRLTGPQIPWHGDSAIRPGVPPGCRSPAAAPPCTGAESAR